MFRNFFIVVLILGGIIIGLKTGIQKGIILKYLDEHPQRITVPPTHFYIGQTLQLFGNLTEATTYYSRVYERYPQSPYADASMYYEKECMDKGLMKGRAGLIVEYEKYLERFPKGEFSEMVRNRVSLYKMGG